jgi:Domain of unknown function (DUF4292)
MRKNILPTFLFSSFPLCKFFSLPRTKFSIQHSAFIILIFLASCKTRQTEKPVVIKESKSKEDKSADELMRLITDSTFNAQWINGKADVEATIGDEKSSFHISLRMKRDSVIWVSISPALGIEVARVLITQDSVKVLDRINNKYKLTDYKFLNDLLRMNVDFDIIQGVLTGNLFSYKKNRLSAVYLEDKYYILSSLSKRKLKRSLEEKDPNKPVVQDIWISDDNYRIIKLSIEDNRVQKSLITDYSNFKNTNAGLFPFNSSTKIKAEKNVDINIEYNKLETGEVQEFPFKVPNSFRVMD